MPATVLLSHAQREGGITSAGMLVPSSVNESDVSHVSFVVDLSLVTITNTSIGFDCLIQRSTDQGKTWFYAGEFSWRGHAKNEVPTAGVMLNAAGWGGSLIRVVASIPVAMLWGISVTPLGSQGE